jgi:hypothetical protein
VSFLSQKSSLLVSRLSSYAPTKSFTPKETRSSSRLSFMSWRFMTSPPSNSSDDGHGGDSSSSSSDESYPRYNPIKGNLRPWPRVQRFVEGSTPTSDPLPALPKHCGVASWPALPLSREQDAGGIALRIDQTTNTVAAYDREGGWALGPTSFTQ